MVQTNNTPQKQVHSLFDRVAPKYDKMNNLITLGLHRRWRAKTMEKLNVKKGDFALDLCCGTGDLTLDLARRVGPSGHVVALDLSAEMLKLAKEKVKTAHLNDRVTLIEGDSMHLPFEDDHFDITTIGFGLRNVPDADQVLREMVRVIRPGGKVACLETSQPQQPLIRLGWEGYFHVVPLMAKMTGSRYQDYDYLQKTTKSFVSVQKLAEMFAAAGMESVKYSLFTFGAGALHIGKKKMS
ncbi:2-heptaprenyl-1,4-naphthoquinone methyltransferase [Liquorilactobacillus sucicola DSM 21376 = JCM 15457]|uniref:Demethylmenaquinone methyltransferase n=1 Tax=Liquorilactobacillus sucicola DSM 21376 = JCM 15457 TaxID=1423806 RepID=A0A023CXW3_9LACO|nr:demethylmenaquinone methyltransferase [Liquorilactobacillus sucicola]KRN06960.1 ubiquinone menaquinone biosynthesis methyltransferase [Liquorilactobacillus sucicola DSM 21376 = JCM 15457]GAJ26441.1 2-heptaprenyl-1,4-naphthoquinone methyltransferase [Liquorilactobacillus sucicola DSM 21376 = JCM 15457]